MALNLSQRDKDLIARLVATEADHSLRRSRPEAYKQQVQGIVDTVLNRMASGQFPNTVAGVSNQHRQFSKIAGPSNLDPYGSVQNAPKAPSYVEDLVTEHIINRMTGDPSVVGGGLHYANPVYSTKNNRVWIDRDLTGPKLGSGDRTHNHGTARGFTPVEASLVDTASIQGEIPRRPENSTAVAAIDAFAPTQKAVVPKLGYASPQKSKPPSFLQKIGGYNNLRGLEKTVVPATQKVASSIGNSFLDTGQSLLSGLTNTAHNLTNDDPTPPTPSLKMASTRSGRATAPARSVNDILLGLGAAVDPNTGNALRGQNLRVPSPPPPRPAHLNVSQPAGQSHRPVGPTSQAQIPLRLPQASQAKLPIVSKPQNTRNFDRAEASFRPGPRNVGVAKVNHIQPLQTDFLTPPPKPQHIANMKLNPLQKAVNNVRQVTAPVRHLRHDIGGQVDGAKMAFFKQMGMADINPRGSLNSALQRALGTEPHHTISLDRAASTGHTIGGNGYIYAGSPKSYQNVGKVVDGKARVSRKPKPKGYRYWDSDENGNRVLKTI